MPRFSKNLLFSNDIAIDLGTTNTLVYVRGRGVVINEPSVVAVNDKTHQVVAVGKGAKIMLGKTPAHIRVVRPLSHGVISDFEVTEELLTYLINKAQNGRVRLFGPRVVIGVPTGVTNVQSRAVRDAAKNAGATGAFIPLLTLGIPANVVMAMMLAALTIHGIRPGPLLISERPDLFWGTITSMYLGNVLLLILNLPLVGLFVQILRVPYPLLTPAILLLCLIGAYSVTGQTADALTMVCFGVAGYLPRKLGFESAPLVLALILGRPMEESLRQALALSQGSFAIFVTRPISLVLLLATVASLAAPLVRRGSRLARA